MSTSIQYMHHALALAELGRSTVSPNPMVGCVIVKHERIIAAAYHQFFGENHAEVLALNQAGSHAKNATLYVTLEPCCHTGKTPPCTRAIIKAGIKKVIVASIDPNPLMSGNGIRELQNAGIQVETGMCAEAAQALNKIFFYYMQHQQPFVIAKWAMSLDGRTVTHSQDSRFITSAATRANTHILRQQVDAVLIGANTARFDNPQLTVRTVKTARQPLRIIVSSRGELPFNLTLFDTNFLNETLLVTATQPAPQYFEFYKQRNIHLLILPSEQNQQVNLKRLLLELGKREISSVLIEGGMQILQQFLNQHLVNEIYAYVAPVIISNLENKKSITNIKFKKMNSDFEFIGEIKHV